MSHQCIAVMWTLVDFQLVPHDCGQQHTEKLTDGNPGLCYYHNKYRLGLCEPIEEPNPEDLIVLITDGTHGPVLWQREGVALPTKYDIKAA